MYSVMYAEGDISQIYALLSWSVQVAYIILTYVHKHNYLSPQNLFSLAMHGMYLHMLGMSTNVHISRHDD